MHRGGNVRSSDEDENRWIIGYLEKRKEVDKANGSPGRSCHFVAPAFQESDKRRPERLVENCVYYGIYGRADVAQPQTRVDHVRRHLAVRTRCEDDIENKERRPTENEREEHQAEDFAGFLLRCNGVQSQRLSFVSIG